MKFSTILITGILATAAVNASPLGTKRPFIGPKQPEPEPNPDNFTNRQGTSFPKNNLYQQGGTFVKGSDNPIIHTNTHVAPAYRPNDQPGGFAVQKNGQRPPNFQAAMNDQPPTYNEATANQ